MTCPSPHVFEGDDSDDLVSEYIDLMGLYRECSTRHNASVK